MRQLIGLLVPVASLLALGCGDSGSTGDARAPEKIATLATPEVSRDAIARTARVQRHVDGVPVYRREILSPVYHIDRLYKSMRGPMSNVAFRLHEREAELLWITGYRADVVASDGRTPLSAEFMCHSSLEVNGARYLQRFPTEMGLTSDRLFTASQGQLGLELPEGFGIPMLSTSHLTLNTQVLNHNLGDADIEARHRVSIDFIRDRDLETPLRPLMQRGVYALRLTDGADGHFGLASVDADESKHGPGCLPGDDASGRESHLEFDEQGRQFTGFWVVEPGRDVNHTRVTTKLDLPYDSTVHAIAVHLHPFAESLELRDLTANATVFHSRAQQVESGIGLSHVETFVSRDGLPLYADHEYELVSVYDNTSDEDQDSMAVMYLYVLVRDLPDLRGLVGTTTATIATP